MPSSLPSSLRSSPHDTLLSFRLASVTLLSFRLASVNGAPRETAGAPPSFCESPPEKVWAADGLGEAAAGGSLRVMGAAKGGGGATPDLRRESTPPGTDCEKTEKASGFVAGGIISSVDGRVLKNTSVHQG